MISDKDLQDAARACEEAILNTLPEPEDCPATFSPAFAQKMKKLIFRVDHPVLYWLTRALLVLLLAGMVVVCALLLCGETAPDRLETPPELPAPVETEGPARRVAYRPTWLPEGCAWDHEALYETEGMIIYTTEGGTQAVFLYAVGGGQLERADLEKGKAVLVGDRPAVLCLGQSKGELNDLFWTDGEVEFWISAPFREEVLIQVAESVEPQEME